LPIGQERRGARMGIASDPLTYVGFGPAARGIRLGGTLFKEAAEKFGLPLVKAFSKGQVLNKPGRAVYDVLLRNRKAGRGYVRPNDLGTSWCV